MAADTVEFVETDAGRLAYLIDGAGGTPLVLAQRFRGTMDDWDPDFIAALAATGRTVVRFDSAVSVARMGRRRTP